MKVSRYRGRKLLASAAGLMALGMIFFGVASGATGTYQVTFDGAPPAPAPLHPGLSDFDIQVHSRDYNTWFQLQEMTAQHGADCSAPPATHTNSSYEGAVFQCRNHVMTALKADGYGLIYLTPAQIFDFSAGGSITWEMSTEKLSTRDWWDVLITPYEQNLSVPLLSSLSQGVDLQGPPLNTIHIGGDNGQGAPLLSIIRNGTQQTYNSAMDVPELGYFVVDGTNEAATRQTFRFTVSNGRMRFERLQSPTATALVYWDVAATANFTSGIVQFGHHSYTPEKDGAGVPATRHWDNIVFSSAEPFTMIKADRRYTTGGVVNFASPAPANSFLRFSGICGVNVDGVRVNRAPSVMGSDIKEEHMSSFWVPIAQGKTSVNISFGADGWYSGPCIAKDFSIWSREASTGTTTTATATATRTATPTSPAQATSTPTTAAATSTPTQVPPTATPTRPPATATPTKAAPTATPTTPAATTQSFTVSASTSKTSLSAGSSIRLTAKVKSALKTRVLVDIEVYGPDGTRVFQRVYDGESFSAGQTKTYMPTWTVPKGSPKGTYTVKVGVFSPGWWTLYHWSDSATRFTVK